MTILVHTRAAFIATLALLAVSGCGNGNPVLRLPVEDAHNPFAVELLSGEQASFFLVDPQFADGGDTRLGYTIRYVLWRPLRHNGRVIVYNHGMQSHRGWFYATAEILVRHGYVVYAFDRIGSGNSDGGLARRGGGLVHHRGHVRDWRLFTQTLDAMLAIAAEDYPGSEMIVWGNSYGATVVTAYLFEYAPSLQTRDVSAAVFTVPGLYLNEASMPLPFSRLSLLLSSNLSYFPVPMVEADDDNGAAWFVGPGKWFERIRDDELSLRHVTRAFYLQTRSMKKAATGRASDVKLPVPAFYLLVRGDPMMDNDRVEQHVSRHATDSWVKYYRGGKARGHFLLFTEDRDEAIADILSFLEGRGAQISGAQHLSRTAHFLGDPKQ